jgi:hypothetical protein
MMMMMIYIYIYIYIINKTVSPVSLSEDSVGGALSRTGVRQSTTQAMTNNDSREGNQIRPGQDSV